MNELINIAEYLRLLADNIENKNIHLDDFVKEESPHERTMVGNVTRWRTSVKMELIIPDYVLEDI